MIQDVQASIELLDARIDRRRARDRALDIWRRTSHLARGHPGWAEDLSTLPRFLKIVKFLAHSRITELVLQFLTFFWNDTRLSSR
jgi:hypothetical protein